MCLQALTILTADLPVAPKRFSVTVVDDQVVVFSWDVVTSAIVSDTPTPPQWRLHTV